MKLLSQGSSTCSSNSCTGSRAPTHRNGHVHPLPHAATHQRSTAARRSTLQPLNVAAPEQVSLLCVTDSTQAHSCFNQALVHEHCRQPGTPSRFRHPHPLPHPSLFTHMPTANPQATAAAPEQQQADEQQRRPITVIAAPASATTSLQHLPQAIRNATAVLEAPNPAAPGGKTLVYVLGASHVSQVSCDQIKELIRAVKPEVSWGVGVDVSR